MSFCCNVGVMGLQGSGRTTLIKSLSSNVSQEIKFIKLNYPDNGKSDTNEFRYDDHIKDIKNKYNLSALFLIVNESFRDKEALLVKIAQQYSITTAVVISMLDLALRNLHPRTHQFTDQEKLNHISKERKFIANFFDGYDIKIFHVSDICFPGQLNNESRPFQKDERILCQFIDSCISSNPTTVLQQLHRPEQNNVDSDFIFSYDIIFIGVKDAGSNEARNGLKKFFDRISIQNIEYDETTKIARKLEDAACKLFVVVVKEHIDKTLFSILDFLKTRNNDFVVVLNTKDCDHAKEMFKNTCSIPLDASLIYGFNLKELENFNVMQNDKLKFLNLVQEKIGKLLKIQQQNNSDDMCSSMKIGLIGLNDSSLSPLYKLLSRQNSDIRKIKYSKIPVVNEIASQIQKVDLAVIVVPELNTEFNSLSENLQRQKLNFLVILDKTAHRKSKHYSIEKINRAGISQLNCFQMFVSQNDNYQSFLDIVEEFKVKYASSGVSTHC